MQSYTQKVFVSRPHCACLKNYFTHCDNYKKCYEVAHLMQIPRLINGKFRFLISRLKHLLWVLKRNVSMR